MRFHWYWPFARSEELDWAHATVRSGEHVVVQVLDREQAPPAGTVGGVTVVRDLPDVNRSARGVTWPISRAGTYRARAAARKRIWREESFDLVHLHYVNRFTDAIVRLPHPLVLSVHDVVPHVPRLGSAVERRLHARLYGRADALVVHHERLADELCARFAVSRSIVHVVPHQVFPVGGVVAAPPEGPPRLLFFGALRDNKGLEVLDEALERIRDEDLEVTIAGRGDERLERLARSIASRDGRVHAEIGHVPLERKRELFGAAHVVVLPYTSFASQSGVLHDAYGHGRPVVVSDVGALGETVREDGTGVVVPPGDAAALAAGIVDALSPERWEPASANCRRIALERSPEAVGRRLREVYDLLLA